MLTYQILNNSSKEDILSKARVGVEFEFYSNLSIEKTRDALKKVVDRKIRIEDKAHSDFIPTEKEWKLEPDMSGGKGLIELVTGSIPYKEIRKVIINILKWINENGYTTKSSSIHLNISFDPKKTEKPELVQRLDPLKFILDFNEREVYKIFPERKDSVYAKSIKWAIPNIEANYFNGQNINSKSFTFPKEKYYGVNFEKLQKGYLEFRYLGGKDYQKRTSDILYLLDRFIYQLWQATTQTKYTELNLIELKKILNKNHPYTSILKDYRGIKKFYPELELTVDLKSSDKIISLYWDKIKQHVVKLLSHSGIEKGHINYDSDLGRVQVKDAEMLLCFDLENYDFVDCKISGTLSFCDFFRCELDSVNIKRCNLYQNTLVSNSKIESCYTNKTVEVRNSYVFQWDSIFKGRMIGGIFRHGKIGKEADFEDVEIINSKKIN